MCGGWCLGEQLLIASPDPQTHRGRCSHPPWVSESARLWRLGDLTGSHSAVAALALLTHIQDTWLGLGFGRDELAGGWARSSWKAWGCGSRLPPQLVPPSCVLVLWVPVCSAAMCAGARTMSFISLRLSSVLSAHLASAPGPLAITSLSQKIF